MAVKSFGFFTTPSTAYWGGVPYYANVGQRAVMPEKGKVIAIRIKLARRTSSDSPIAWGVIWNRSTGAKIVQSTNSINILTTYTTAAAMPTYEFLCPETLIEAGTLLWIGYGKVSNSSPKDLYFGIKSNQTGQYVDTNDDSQSSPAANFNNIDETFSNATLWVEVVYKTGGETKVWNGASYVSKAAKVWDGGSWLAKPIKVWTGSLWADSNS